MIYVHISIFSNMLIQGAETAIKSNDFIPLSWYT